ncbi:hypothetical protein OIU34_17145 [Pararhizobium sp. BT-229]|uniref:hypothetical protein n=1 Tax=Pararhizobium sp. BT-229 TaxID=2986923 RepID=UPI0021F7538A|nr:hypothetical protein [Pararhizobium sp. BT-229]MCV9963628.1 hypothetical protein [Pararhizobium sp. BT-229]
MATNSDPVTPDDAEAVDKDIAKQTGVLRYVEDTQYILATCCSLFLMGAALGSGDFKNTFIYAIVGAIVLIAALLPFNFTFRRLSKAAYHAFYASREFVTPSGEQVAFVASNHTGTHLTVRFQDGHEDEYPLHCLTNIEGRFHDWARFTHDGDDHFKMFSKVKWMTQEGKIGVVRGVYLPKDGDALVKLKLEDGQIGEFKLGSLEPLPVSAREGVKPQAVS